MNTVLAATLKEAGQCLNWTSLQLNVGTASTCHADSKNVGLSARFAFGQFDGGEFFAKTPPAFAPQGFDVYGRLQLFDGHLQHKTSPHRGTRISVVAFQHPLWGSTTLGVRGQLKQLGFVLDDWEAWRPPIRLTLDKKSISEGGSAFTSVQKTSHWGFELHLGLLFG